MRRFKILKRGFDLMISVLLLFLFSPLFLILAIFIRLESAGPVLVKEKKIGQNFQPFYIWKFRTRINLSSGRRPEDFSLFGEEEPGLTLMGSFLKKFHLDILPALWNVLKGDMSLVGISLVPFESVEELQSFFPQLKKIWEIKPGLISLGRIKGGSSYLRKVIIKQLRYDLFYLKKMCWVFDFKIISWQVLTFLKGTI